MKDLILLHGALGSKEQLRSLEGELSAAYKIHLLNLPGHGGESIDPYGFSIPGFAEALKDYAEGHHLQNPSIFGYSMGGFVALYAAGNQLFAIDKIITLATKFDWSPAIAEKETAMLDPAGMEKKVPAFVEVLAKRHAPLPWKEHIQLTAQLMRELGDKNPLGTGIMSSIDNPCLLLLGDMDKMVTMEETIITTEKLPRGDFKLLPQTPHPIEKVDTKKLAEIIHSFLKEG